MITNNGDTVFLLALADALRPLADPIEIQGTAVRALGEYLRSDRVYYVEVDRERREYVVEREWVAAGVASHARRYPLEAWPMPWLVNGRPWVVRDVDVDAAMPDDQRASYRGNDIRACVIVPLIKDGRLVATLVANSRTPRDWTSSEVGLLVETAERTWAAVERARAEDALRRAHDELELRVHQRTADLGKANFLLQQEVAERRAAEAKIKSLFERLISIQEEERRRIARDIHDHLGQQLTALRINLEVLRTRSGAPNYDEHAARTQQLAEEIDRSLDFLTWDLRPAALDQLGLAAAVEQLVLGWSERFGIDAQFEASVADTIRLPANVESNLYRVVQEALHNVFKHAGADRVVVTLQREGGHTTLIIQDNGQGFDAHAAAAAGGLGLISMRERATIAGGTLEIVSRRGHGTSVIARVPFA